MLTDGKSGNRHSREYCTHVKPCVSIAGLNPQPVDGTGGLWVIDEVSHTVRLDNELIHTVQFDDEIGRAGATREGDRIALTICQWGESRAIDKVLSIAFTLNLILRLRRSRRERADGVGGLWVID
jgi:hypothetical protein